MIDMILTTSRLTLRPPVAADAPQIVAAINDFEVARWLTHVPYPYTIKDADDFIERQTSRKTFMVHCDTGLIGCIGVVGECGYWLGRAHWGQGYMTEASEAVLAWHFANDATDLKSSHMIGNDRSRRVMKKMGFRDTDVIRRVSKATNEEHDYQNMLLTRAAWEART